MTITKQSSRRKELVSAAAHLFKENSFNRTTVRMIASETGIKSGSLFHHFKDKEEILVAVIEGGLTKSLETIEEITNKNDSPQKQLFAAILGHLITLHGSDKDAHIVSITEWNALSEGSKKHLITIRDDYEALWQKIIDDAIKEELLCGDSRLLRRLLLGALNWTIQWYSPKNKLTIQDVAEQCYQSITHQKYSPE